MGNNCKHPENMLLLEDKLTVGYRWCNLCMDWVTVEELAEQARYQEIAHSGASHADQWGTW